MGMVEIIGISAGVLTTAGIIPQIFKAYNTKKVEGLSPVMFSILTIGVGLWVWYGIEKEDMPIIVMNGISFSLNALMLLLYFRFK
ncbi:SemiSWEET family sugar transporter [Constantimarinum furrinae]|uniref:MtN3 and saliva related transmembrane protein n=1 Tax=Constantimarinum furrinae TaxID=2562285 RepID=A0A7G8PWV9_9FLAO|nr:SemiSWEET transporter [Constantimarinum furrinae]QNJ98825.1 hypothetical protein ALE3EI_2283 [Constantimarinum furrinae]